MAPSNRCILSNFKFEYIALNHFPKNYLEIEKDYTSSPKSQILCST